MNITSLGGKSLFCANMIKDLELRRKIWIIWVRVNVIIARKTQRVRIRWLGGIHRLDGHGFGWIPGVGDGQGGLACCSSWGHKELDTTEWLNWNELKDLMTLNIFSNVSLPSVYLLWWGFGVQIFACVSISLLIFLCWVKSTLYFGYSPFSDMSFANAFPGL